MIVLPGTPYDVKMLCRNMRQSDIEELAEVAVFQGKPKRNRAEIERDLLDALDGNFWSVWLGDHFIGMGGISPCRDDPLVGIIWFLGTPHADSNIVSLTLRMRQFIMSFIDNFHLIGNVVPAHMTERISWLKLLGFDFEPEQANKTHTRVVAFSSQPTSARRPVSGP